jgi:hypothetical protein
MWDIIIRNSESAGRLIRLLARLGIRNWEIGLGKYEPNSLKGINIIAQGNALGKMQTETLKP